MSQISAYYAAADVFALSSDYDPSPKALSEALVFSLPIVCTKMIGTAPDLVKEGENGYLYQVGDVETLSSRLYTLLNDEKHRKAMGRKSRALADQWSAKAAGASIVQAVYRVTRGDNCLYETSR
jgi:glycosyltransferase involved in cell wall biosynthesis